MTTPLNFITIDRHWFLTWTTYGTWLPGDQRGFVGRRPDELGRNVRQNKYGTPAVAPNGRLRNFVRSNLKAPPIVLDSDQAAELFKQFEETARIRGWLLIAVGIMPTHIHIVVGVPGDPDPDKILTDFKAYGSGRLNKKWGKPTSDTWWTTGGSTRKLPDDHSVEAAIQYIREQQNPLLIWTREEGLLSLK